MCRDFSPHRNPSPRERSFPGSLLLDVAGALDALPSLPLTEMGRQVARVPGTEGRRRIVHDSDAQEDAQTSDNQGLSRSTFGILSTFELCPLSS
jgi:hypothetical protein